MRPNSAITNTATIPFQNALRNKRPANGPTCNRPLCQNLIASGSSVTCQLQSVGGFASVLANVSTSVATRGLLAELSPEALSRGEGTGDRRAGFSVPGCDVVRN